ncbi:LOW QUALITY PROTEIN: lymphocyte antigen 6 complex locus protein G5b [Ctenodactylus gundi]
MKACILVGMLVMVGFTMGKDPVPKVQTCHFCLSEDPSVGCISGSEKCSISRMSPCMVIAIHYGVKVCFNIRGCGQYNSYRCQEKHYFSNYWYQAQCCQYDYCNSWSSPQLQSSLPKPSGRPLTHPLSDLQIRQSYRALNLSSPLPGPCAEQEPQGLGRLELGWSIADLRHIYLFLNSSGLWFFLELDPDTFLFSYSVLVLPLFPAFPASSAAL